MAASARTLVLLVLCFFLILTFYVQDTGSARGGYRSGYRGGYRSSWFRTRTSYGRVRMGTGGYYSSTWKAAARAGEIYGGSRYMRGSYYRQYPYRMPPICTNNYEVAPNGRVYGNFICPRENEPADADRCCGDFNREFCCPQNYYDYTATWVIVVVVVVVVVVIIIIVVVIVIWCKKRRHQQTVRRKPKPEPNKDKSKKKEAAKDIKKHLPAVTLAKQ